MKVLLLGGSGQLGSEIRARWDSDEIVAPAHDELDVESTSDFAAMVVRSAPTSSLTALRFTTSTRASPSRSAPSLLMRSPSIVLRHCARRAISHFLTISTDYVFDGVADAPYTEEDCARPYFSIRCIEARGRTTGAAPRDEGLCRAHVRRFPACTHRRARARSSTGSSCRRVPGETPHVVSDVVVLSPTYAGDLAIALRRLIGTGEYRLCPRL